MDERAAPSENLGVQIFAAPLTSYVDWGRLPALCTEVSTSAKHAVVSTSQGYGEN